jgi:nucleoside-diphosphate-sugar epimerase
VSTILVTGASGFVGGAAASQLAALGHRVIGLTRRANSKLPGRVEPLIGPDLAEWPESAGFVLPPIDAVLHCAARVHVLHETEPDPLSAFRRANVQGTLSLARAAAQAGTKRFVFVSSIGVCGDASTDGPFSPSGKVRPATPYAASKLEAEILLTQLGQQLGVATTIVRPPMVYGRGAPGNFALLVRAVHSGIPLPLGRLSAKRSFISQENLASFLVSAATSDPAVEGTFHVSDCDDLSTSEFIRAIAKAMDRRAILLPVPLSLLTFLAQFLGRSDQLRKLAVPLQVDSTASCEAFAWSPPRSVASSLQRCFRHDNPVDMDKCRI